MPAIRPGAHKVSCSEQAAISAADFQDYHYELPAELIAQFPAERRGDARLLLVERGGTVRGERSCRELPQLLEPGDLLVLNESRVLPARLWTRRASGGRVELLLIRPQSDTGDPAIAATDLRSAAGQSWRAMARPARRLRVGEILSVVPAPGADDAAPAPQNRTVLGVVIREVLGDGFILVAPLAGDLRAIAEERGEMPLPPYIRRDADVPDLARRRRDDRRRYQTVYARTDQAAAGSVAAPTAGLHFSTRTLTRLEQRGVALAYVTLHVGPGTFRPPTAGQYRCQRLHRERFHFPAATDAALAAARRRSGKIFAVGTTTLRVLETVARLGLPGARRDAVHWGPDSRDPEPVFCGEAIRQHQGWDVRGETRLFLRPPDVVTAVDGLLTNFHLPGSSLLMLIAAMAGDAAWRAAYNHAVSAGMRFYSYGDAMLLLPPGYHDGNGAVGAGGGR